MRSTTPLSRQAAHGRHPDLRRVAAAGHDSTGSAQRRHHHAARRAGGGCRHGPVDLQHGSDRPPRRSTGLRRQRGPGRRRERDVHVPVHRPAGIRRCGTGTGAPRHRSRCRLSSRPATTPPRSRSTSQASFRPSTPWCSTSPSQARRPGLHRAGSPGTAARGHPRAPEPVHPDPPGPRTTGTGHPRTARRTRAADGPRRSGRGPEPGPVADTHVLGHLANPDPGDHCVHDPVPGGPPWRGGAAATGLVLCTCKRKGAAKPIARRSAGQRRRSRRRRWGGRRRRTTPVA